MFLQDVASVASNQSVQLTPQKTIATPNVQTGSKSPVPQAKKAVNRLTSTGGTARPRRENRQPPKHLREAFDQLESEGVNLKRTTPKPAVSAPTSDVTASQDAEKENPHDESIEMEDLDQSQERDEKGLACSCLIQFH